MDKLSRPEIGTWEFPDSPLEGLPSPRPAPTPETPRGRPVRRFSLNAVNDHRTLAEIQEVIGSLSGHEELLSPADGESPATTALAAIREGKKNGLIGSVYKRDPQTGGLHDVRLDVFVPQGSEVPSETLARAATPLVKLEIHEVPHDHGADWRDLAEGTTVTLIEEELLGLG